jgi:hypothetical protein
MVLPDNPIDPDEPAISQLAAYLHQDWADEYDNVWEAVRNFCSDQSVDEVRRSADQVHALIRSELDEKQLMDATVKLGIYYYPPGSGLTYREWLRDLEALLRAHG